MSLTQTGDKEASLLEPLKQPGLQGMRSFEGQASEPGSSEKMPPDSPLAHRAVMQGEKSAVRKSLAVDVFAPSHIETRLFFKVEALVREATARKEWHLFKDGLKSIYSYIVEEESRSPTDTTMRVALAAAKGCARRAEELLSEQLHMNLNVSQQVQRLRKLCFAYNTNPEDSSLPGREKMDEIVLQAKELGCKALTNKLAMVSAIATIGAVPAVEAVPVARTAEALLAAEHRGLRAEQVERLAPGLPPEARAAAKAAARGKLEQVWPGLPDEQRQACALAAAAQLTECLPQAVAVAVGEALTKELLIDQVSDLLELCFGAPAKALLDSARRLDYALNPGAGALLGSQRRSHAPTLQQQATLQELLTGLSWQSSGASRVDTNIEAVSQASSRPEQAPRRGLSEQEIGSGLFARVRARFKKWVGVEEFGDSVANLASAAGGRFGAAAAAELAVPEELVHAPMSGACRQASLDDTDTVDAAHGHTPGTHQVMRTVIAHAAWVQQAELQKAAIALTDAELAALLAEEQARLARSQRLVQRQMACGRPGGWLHESALMVARGRRPPSPPPRCPAGSLSAVADEVTAAAPGGMLRAARALRGSAAPPRGVLLACEEHVSPLGARLLWRYKEARRDMNTVLPPLLTSRHHGGPA